MTDPPPQRPPMQTRDTLSASRLNGTLQKDDVVAVEVVQEENGVAQGVKSESQDPDVDSDGSLEDYDTLEVDPDTLVANSRRGMSSSYRPSGSVMSTELNDEARTQAGSDVAGTAQSKRSSLHVRLAKTDTRGRYVLTADDPELQEILRKGLERENRDDSKKPRVRFRDLVFTRQFTTFDRQNPTSSNSPFFGFFTLFWLALVLMFVQISLKNWRDYGSILGSNEMMKIMFSRDVLVLGITDGVMYVSCLEGYFFQKLVQKGYINWSRGGWVIQNIWQSAYLAAVIGWAYFREWPWTHTIFAVLHGLVFVMKQHSYAFYNGYLSSIYRRRILLERKMKQLEAMEPSPTSPASPSYQEMSSGIDLAIDRSTTTTAKRRPSLGPRTSTNFTVESSDIASIASAIESNKPISYDQMQAFAAIIKDDMADLTQELQGKAASPQQAYPHNLTLFNLAEYICLPTLVYELEYPRQAHINWWYVLEKSTATFGVLCVMMVVSQAFIYPSVAKTIAMKDAGLSMEARWREFPFIVSDILFPLLLEQLLTWYLIWECILNVLAELTRFADRGFYGDWWNSVTWDQYARDWNRPVHNFLLRHVYHSSISTFRLSRTAATFVTFLLSALVHEMCMAILFKKIRGYLFWMQLLQMPLVMVSRSKLLKGRVVLGNVIFWMGLFVGPSILTSLYLVI
nr:probable sterol O-acyltransferase 1 [Quercus suber]